MRLIFLSFVLFLASSNSLASEEPLLGKSRYEVLYSEKDTRWEKIEFIASSLAYLDLLKQLNNENLIRLSNDDKILIENIKLISIEELLIHSANYHEWEGYKAAFYRNFGFYEGFMKEIEIEDLFSFFERNSFEEIIDIDIPKDHQVQSYQKKWIRIAKEFYPDNPKLQEIEVPKETIEEILDLPQKVVIKKRNHFCRFCVLF